MVAGRAAGGIFSGAPGAVQQGGFANNQFGPGFTGGMGGQDCGNLGCGCVGNDNTSSTMGFLGSGRGDYKQEKTYKYVGRGAGEFGFLQERKPQCASCYCITLTLILTFLLLLLLPLLYIMLTPSSALP